MKLKRLIPATLVGVSGLALAGLMAMQSPVVAADGPSDDEAAKREDGTVELALVADDDDDDTGDRSRDTNDNTRSNYTAVSRDRDLSRGDKTRDRTRDGRGDDRQRDWSADHTNDRSRNDTRG